MNVSYARMRFTLWRVSAERTHKTGQSHLSENALQWRVIPTIAYAMEQDAYKALHASAFGYEHQQGLPGRGLRRERLMKTSVTASRLD